MEEEHFEPCFKKMHKETLKEKKCKGRVAQRKEQCCDSALDPGSINKLYSAFRNPGTPTQINIIEYSLYLNFSVKEKECNGVTSTLTYLGNNDHLKLSINNQSYAFSLHKSNFINFFEYGN